VIESTCSGDLQWLVLSGQSQAFFSFTTHRRRHSISLFLVRFGHQPLLEDGHKTTRRTFNVDYSISTFQRKSGVWQWSTWKWHFFQNSIYFSVSGRLWAYIPSLHIKFTDIWYFIVCISLYVASALFSMCKYIATDIFTYFQKFRWENTKLNA
jgi:hypothetical protein